MQTLQVIPQAELAFNQECFQLTSLFQTGKSFDTATPLPLKSTSYPCMSL